VKPKTVNGLTFSSAINIKRHKVFAAPSLLLLLLRPAGANLPQLYYMFESKHATPLAWQHRARMPLIDAPL
jgi:hypothetical protein